MPDIVLTDEVSRSDVAEDVLINLPLVVFAIELAVQLLCLLGIVLDLVHVLRLHVLRVDFLRDHEVSFNHNIYMLGWLPFLDQQAVLRAIVIVKC